MCKLQELSTQSLVVSLSALELQPLQVRHLQTMLKLLQLLALAAVVAIAVSAPVSQFLNDDDADLDLQVFEDVTDDLDNEASATNPAVADPCPTHLSPCPIGQFLNPSGCQCQLCPAGLTSSYSPIKPFPNVGAASCYACKPNLPNFFFKCPASAVCGTFQICVNFFDIPSVGRLLSTFRWEALKTDGNGKLFLDGLLKQLAAALTKTVMNFFAPKAAPNAVQVDAQVDAQDAVATCALDAVGCCLPGSYGIDGRNCVACPAKHTSPYAVPGATCSCPNTLSSSCKSCSICEMLDGMNQCVSKCPGKKCSLTSNTKAIPKINAGVCY